MLARVRSATLLGIESIPLFVECDISRGLPGIHTVGLPDAAVRESRDRVKAALKNCGYDIPPTHIVINLAPADIKKEGSGFDLPMALGIGEGAQQTAPLGRAVIGGLLFATAATLLALPLVFSMVQERAGVKSPSLDPEDPQSAFAIQQPENQNPLQGEAP